MLLKGVHSLGGGEVLAVLAVLQWTIVTPIARAVPDLGAVREGPYVNGKLRATGRATKF